MRSRSLSVRPLWLNVFLVALCCWLVVELLLCVCCLLWWFVVCIFFVWCGVGSCYCYNCCCCCLTWVVFYMTKVWMIKVVVMMMMIAQYIALDWVGVDELLLYAHARSLSLLLGCFDLCIGMCWWVDSVWWGVVVICNWGVAVCIRGKNTQWGLPVIATMICYAYWRCGWHSSVWWWWLETIVVVVIYIVVVVWLELLCCVLCVFVCVFYWLWLLRKTCTHLYVKCNAMTKAGWRWW